MNATVWVYDGLLYATASFAYGRPAGGSNPRHPPSKDGQSRGRPALLLTRRLGPRVGAARNALAVGVCCFFAPALYFLHSDLLGLWTAKALLNGFRCAAALWRIHIQLAPSWARAPAALV